MEYLREVFENNTVVDAARVLNKFDAALHELFTKLDIGEYVWENEAPAADFAAQDVVVEITKTPKYYEIEFTGYTTADNIRFTTGKIPIEYATQLQVLYSSTVRYRDVSVVQEEAALTFTFSTGQYSSSSVSAKYAIPQRIKLYY